MRVQINLGTSSFVIYFKKTLSLLIFSSGDYLRSFSTTFVDKWKIPQQMEGREINNIPLNKNLPLATIAAHALGILGQLFFPPPHLL